MVKYVEEKKTRPKSIELVISICMSIWLKACPTWWSSGSHPVKYCNALKISVEAIEFGNRRGAIRILPVDKLNRLKAFNRYISKSFNENSKLRSRGVEKAEPKRQHQQRKYEITRMRLLHMLDVNSLK